MSDDKPIGWWLKHLDRVLEDALGGALADEGVDRRQWQLLNVAAAGGTAQELAPFFTDPADADGPVRELAARGWVRRDGEHLALTPGGSAARDRLLAVVREQRQRLTAGIAPAEYAATVDVLRRMAANAAG